MNALNTQGELRMLAEVLPPQFLADDLIEQCRTFQEALGVSRALARRKMSDGDLADTLGPQRSVLSRIQHKPKNSPAYMPEDRYGLLCEALGNVGIVQWLASQVGCTLVPARRVQRSTLLRESA